MKIYSPTQNFNTCHLLLHVLVQRTIILWSETCSIGWHYYSSAFDCNETLYLIWVWSIGRVMLIGSTQTDNCLTVTVPLYRLSLCHFTDCHCATLPTVTVPPYRLSLCHLIDYHYASVSTVIVPLYRLSLCHFTDCHCATLPTVTVPPYRLKLCHFTDCHFSTLPTATVPLYRLSLCHLTDCPCHFTDYHYASLPTPNLTWTEQALTPIVSSEMPENKGVNFGKARFVINYAF
jgi:hypothetical protein